MKLPNHFAFVFNRNFKSQYYESSFKKKVYPEQF